MHLIAIHGMTDDTETWSGEIVQAKHYSKWLEYYEEAIYRTEYYTEEETYYSYDEEGHSESHTRTVTKSRQVFDHWEPRNRWHNDSWDCNSSIDTSYDIDKDRFNYFVKKFGDIHPVPGNRSTWEHNSKMIEGDPNDYESHNHTGWIEPVTKLVHFENRIKAAPSIYSFVKVPTNIPVFSYPKNSDPFHSDRLMGEARKTVDPFKFDQLNAKLGISKKVNVILIGFGKQDSMIAEYQRAKFIGGKKNDLVLCYGNGWSRVFGWTEKEIVKANLATILLQNPVDNDILPLIEKEIRLNYTIKDWHKFDYLQIEPRAVHFIWFAIILVVVEVGLYIYFWNDGYDKDMQTFRDQEHTGFGWPR